MENVQADPVFEEAVSRGAAAIHAHKVLEARKMVDETPFSIADLTPLICNLKAESETAQVLIFQSYLDDKLTELIKRNLVHLKSKTEEDQLFGLAGPLSTFNMRILMAYHLGWMSSQQKRNLDAFRKIRNDFGHRAYKTSFSEPRVAKQWARIDVRLHSRVGYVLDAMKQFPEKEFHQIESLTPDLVRLCTFAILAHTSFLELLLFPISRAVFVAPDDIRGDFETGPKVVQHLHRELSRALLHCLAK